MLQGTRVRIQASNLGKDGGHLGCVRQHRQCNLDSLEAEAVLVNIKISVWQLRGVFLNVYKNTYRGRKRNSSRPS